MYISSHAQRRNTNTHTNAHTQICIYVYVVVVPGGNCEGSLGIDAVLCRLSSLLSPHVTSSFLLLDAGVGQEKRENDNECWGKFLALFHSREWIQR